MFYTKELVLGEPLYNTLEILRTKPENFRNAFRSFQLLNSNAMCVFGLFRVS